MYSLSEHGISRIVIGILDILLGVFLAACIGWLPLVDLISRQILPHGFLPIWYLSLLVFIPLGMIAGGVLHILASHEDLVNLSLISILLHAIVWVISLLCITTSGRFVVFHIIVLIFTVLDILVTLSSTGQIWVPLVVCIAGVLGCFVVPAENPVLFKLALQETGKVYWQSWLDSEYSDTWWGSLLTDAIQSELGAQTSYDISVPKQSQITESSTEDSITDWFNSDDKSSESTWYFTNKLTEFSAENLPFVVDIQSLQQDYLIQSLDIVNCEIDPNNPTNYIVSLEMNILLMADNPSITFGYFTATGDPVGLSTLDLRGSQGDLIQISRDIHVDIGTEIITL